MHWGEVEGHLRHPPTPPSGPEHELPLKKKMLIAAFTINETTMLIIIKSTRATIILGFTRRSLVQRAYQQIVIYNYIYASFHDKHLSRGLNISIRRPFVGRHNSQSDRHSTDLDEISPGVEQARDGASIGHFVIGSKTSFYFVDLMIHFFRVDKADCFHEVTSSSLAKFAVRRFN